MTIALAGIAAVFAILAFLGTCMNQADIRRMADAIEEFAGAMAAAIEEADDAD